MNSGVLAETPSVAVSSPTRSRPRHRLQTLAYINIDHANGGIIRDLSECGIALQAVAPLRPQQQVHLRFELLNPRVKVETMGRVQWADATGQAGLEFSDLSSRSRGMLKEWIFTQLLTSAHHAFGTDGILGQHAAEETPELKFSPIAVSPIRLPLRASRAREIWEDVLQSQNSAWFAAERLVWLVDGLVLLSAVLLFSVIALGITREFPAWPVALALVCGSAAIFTGVYWFLFVVWSGTTPGMYLSGLTSDHPGDEMEDLPRFR